MAELKPFLKWVGGKRQLMTEIKARLPEEYDTFYEPFVGAGSVLFNLKPEKAVINDYNAELINTYLTIKNDLDKLVTELEKLQKRVNSSSFYEIRAWDRDPDFLQRPAAERAARTIYLNKTCFNGMYRVNPKGYFNSSFNKSAKTTIFNPELLTKISEFLKTNEIEIHTGDYKEITKLAVAGDFVYLDPPYDYETRAGFNSYTNSPFGRLQQEELFNELKELDNKGVMWLYSNNSTFFINDLFKDYEITEVSARRSVNSKASARGKVPEVLIKNF